MKQSELLESLAEYVYKISHSEVVMSKDEINLALVNWVIDNDIIIVGPPSDGTTE